MNGLSGITAGKVYKVFYELLDRTLNPKHYRHYNVELLINQTKPYFNLKEIYFIHNFKSIKTRIINFLLVNKFFILNNVRLRSIFIKYYRTNLRVTNEKNAAHLFAVFQKK